MAGGVVVSSRSELAPGGVPTKASSLLTNKLRMSPNPVGAAVRRFDLPAMAFYQALKIWQVYISIPFVMAETGSALTAGHFEKPKVTKGSNPLHSVPRLDSACLHSGLAPWARRHRPSLAAGG